ncbi:hypothetical protein A2707_05995 [Candidatus Saccharibacteria bacterium RIFCSPHIGHO2_01_FULL_45_15]|nr:MAG: hypothetical protein A2707_05995 [Candidatus Saccharibacteria bacterium RIFCSPHIGHO2_01_FULL_45_15]OGL28996.1 MAG: hypothetical protein A3C39_06220 [Candidatus Saccharibacteria bacterium RIFCSPHIGHO2_02_FULL_46_12]OGL32011.1 MAG: hypothetical protein A3E76_01940 [Candidatus Saccharibacteria bacterium RIFCSPHIGHO2_12_FULL_44_22]
MYKSPAKPGWYKVDGENVYLDSKSEAIFIRRLVRNGFSGKWRRPSGVALGKNQYTPDFELSVVWNGQNSRAHVEYKSTSATEFEMDHRRRALAALHYHGSNPLLLLYVNKTKRWYYIDHTTKHVINCTRPTPSSLQISAYQPARSRVPITNKYGRKYKSDTKAFFGNKIADALEFSVKMIFGSPKKKRKKRRK